MNRQALDTKFIFLVVPTPYIESTLGEALCFACVRSTAGQFKV